MIRELPPSQRPDRQPDPEPEDKWRWQSPTHGMMSEIVKKCEPALRGAWAKRPDDNVFLVLADMRLKTLRAEAEEFWGKPKVDDLCRECSLDGSRAIMAYARPLAALDALGVDDDWDENAKALRALLKLAAAGQVGLLVRLGGAALDESTMTTLWAQPGFTLEAN
jgi:hypothetical protein